MRKEIIISIVVGLVAGLIIVYGVYTARTSLTKSPQDQPLITSSPSPTASPQTGELAIHNPEDELMTDQQTLTITGTTVPQNYIVVFINDEEYITIADETGSFSVDGTLEIGSNIIAVHAINSEGDEVVAERTVIYSTTPLLEETSSEEATPSATPEVEGEL